MTADGVALYIGEFGPMIDRANAVEFAADEVRRRDGARYVFDLVFEAVEVGSVMIHRA